MVLEKDYIFLKFIYSHLFFSLANQKRESWKKNSSHNAQWSDPKISLKISEKRLDFRILFDSKRQI